MKIEIFRAGTQTDSAGVSRDWTEADLDTIASSYDPKNHEAPICLGHPKDNAPAWGWVKSVSREGSRLFAEIGDLVSEFSTMLDKKMFKKRSISLYPDLKLRHVAFLGAQPPAVKGLEDFAFADSGALTIDFMEWDSAYGFNNVGRLMQGFRDWIIETKDAATADRLLPQYDIDYLKSLRAESKDAFAYEETSKGDSTMETKDQVTTNAEFAEQLATLTTNVTALTARAVSAEAEVATLKKEKRSSELSQFADRMVNAGKLTPAGKAGAIAIMESLDGQAEANFTEGEGAAAKTVKKTPLKIFQDGIESAAPQITFGEFATKKGAVPAPADDKLAQLTRAEVLAHPELSYGEAGKRVLANNPDLNIAVEI
ncbi:MAG: hypothetical protein ABIW76_14440 [Fibrobacteria bacterium]